MSVPATFYNSKTTGEHHSSTNTPSAMDQNLLDPALRDFNQNIAFDGDFNYDTTLNENHTYISTHDGNTDNYSAIMSFAPGYRDNSYYSASIYGDHSDYSISAGGNQYNSILNGDATAPLVEQSSNHLAPTRPVELAVLPALQCIRATGMYALTTK